MEDFYRRTSDIHEMNSLFSRESDRSAALLSTNFLEVTLENLLTSFFVEEKDINRLYKEPYPLSTFSAKIEISYFLGLVNNDMRHDLNEVRKIRNEFAHTWKELSFENPPISDRCLNFKITKHIFFNKDSENETLVVNPKATQKSSEAISANEVYKDNRRELFRLTVTSLIGCINLISQTEIALGHKRIPLEFDYLGRNLF